MANLRGLIARGGKSGAFALGFSDKMKSVAGAMAVLALATTGTVVVQSQAAPAAYAAQDSVESPGNWLGQKTVNGKVFLDRDANVASAQNVDEPLAGVKVYAQWIDYNNKKQRGAVSPVYTTQTNADGTYTISLPDWTDALGTVHKWEATAGQKLRIWADNPDPKNLQVAFIEGDSVFGGQGDRYLGTWNGTVGIQLAENYNISYHERDVVEDGQDWLYLPEDKSTTGEAHTGEGWVQGRVYYDQRGTFGNLVWDGQYETRYGDVAVPKVKIRGSYVQDEVARRFDQWKKDNKGYTTEAFRAAQKTIMAEYEAETGKSAIAETVITETDNEGKYRLQFKGLYGDAYDYKGIVAGTKFGELAGSSTEGSWLAGNLQSKHINQDYMYVSPVLSEGVDANMDSVQSAMFQDVTRTSMTHTVTDGGPRSNYVNSLDFQLRQTSRGFDVTPYNTTDNPAAPGDTAKTETFGLTPNTAHVIVWTDSEGKEVHRCEANSDNLGVIPSCDFQVSEDLAEDTVYTATVYNAADESTPLMADSFLAYVAPEYKETEVKVGEEATAERPVNKNGTAVPASAKFAAATADDVKNAPEFQKAGLPEDVAPQDWVTVNADGTLTIKPGADVEPGTYNVPVKVTYEDGTTKVINAPIKVVDETKQSDEYTPAYEDKLVVPGEETTSSPTFTDKEGKDVEVPADSKFTIPEDFTVPEGYEVSIDENSGEITVTFPDESKLNGETAEEFNVPVTVTYSDGSTDEVQANFQLDTDGDGEPDVTDTDDDGDGIPDEDDSNPKVPNANDHYDPKYEDGSGKPGSDVKIDAPSFTDKNGKDTTAPEGTKFTNGEGAPEGVTVNEDGSITVTVPEDANPGETITVPVEVTYPDGTKDNVDVTVTVTEKDNGVFDPAYESQLVVPGEETTSSPTFTDKEGKDAKAPEGSKFTIGEDFTVPEGYEVKIDESNGEITVTVDGGKLNKDTEEEFDVPVTVTYPDGSTDKTDANFKLDTDGDGTPDTTDEDDDGDGVPDTEEIEKGTNPKDKNERPLTPIEPSEPTTGATVEPKYEDTLVVPGTDAKSTPSFVKEDEDGNPTEEKVDVPEGSKFTIGEDFTVPEGYTVTIDESTGVVTVTADPEKLNKDTVEEFDVPVTVTYPDGSKDDAKANFKLDTDGDGTPDTTDEDDDGDGVPDTEEIEKGTNPKDKNERPLTPIEPGNPTDAATFEPEYNNGTGQPGDEVEIDAPTFKDSDNKETTPPTGTTFTLGEGTPDGVTVNPDGSITVTIPEDATPGTKITVPVVVTYPDETQDNVDVTVTVTEKDATPVTPVAPTVTNPSSGASADDPASCDIPPYVTVTETEGVEYKVTVDGKELTPDAEGKFVYEYGQTVKVEATPAAGYTFADGAQTTWTWTTAQNEVCEAPETKDNENFEPGYEDGSGKPGDDVTVDKPVFKDNNGEETTPPEGTKFEKGEGAPENVTVNEDGSITVKVPEDANPGDKITVPVVVTYPDGSTDEVEVTVTVEQPDAPAEKPDWKDDKGKPGDKVEIPNDGGPVPGDTTVETEGPGKAEIDEDGKLIVDIDKDAKPGDKVVVIVKDKDDNEIDRVVVEVEQPDAPAEDPKWEDTTTTPDKPVEIPNTGGDVPEGTTVETEGPGKAEIGEDGTITVTPNEDAKPGDTIVVEVKDPEGNVIDTVEVEITEEGDQPAPGGSSDLPEGLIPGLIGGGIIGGIIGGNLGSSHGSSTPGQGAGSGHGSADKGAADKGADKGAADKGAQGAEKGAQQGGNAGQSGAAESGQSGAAQSGASSSSSSADRQGSLAMTGVSGVAIMLGAAAMALAIGGALLAGRRRREN